MTPPIPTKTASKSSDSIRRAENVVRILLFSVLRERLGKREIEVQIECGATTEDLRQRLVEAHPEIRSYSNVMRLAVNERYVDGVVELADGDEVALITPVSGG